MKTTFFRFLKLYFLFQTKNLGFDTEKNIWLIFCFKIIKILIKKKLMWKNI